MRWGPSPDEVAELAAGLRLGVSRDEASQHAEFAAELLAAVQTLPADERPARVPHELVDRADDPLNALVRRCTVEPTADGPLADRRVTVKDTVAVAGLPLTAGSAVLQGYVPSRNSTVVRRIRAAGGRIVAVTNMDDLAFCADGSSSVYGPVRHPLDPLLTAGGSSGGAAASLHYDHIDLAIGGDQAGSVRIPASWCGVVGLKPTHGLVPCSGVLGYDRTVDHIGPLACSVSDAALLLDAIAGADDGDQGAPGVGAVAAVASASRIPASLRLGLLAEGLETVEPATAAVLQSLVENLREAGATVRSVSVPEHLTTAGIEMALSAEGMATLLRAGGNGYGWQGRYAPGLAVALREGLARRGSELSPHVKVGLLVGSWLADRHGGEWYARAQNARHVVRRAYDRALEDLDALLLPTTPFPARAPLAGESVAEVVSAGWAPLANTSPFNLAGHPAVSLPVCEVDGLPLGAMLVGHRFGDAALLACARTIEAASEGD